MPDLLRHSLAEVADELRAASSIVVLGHVRPDGDAIGSQIALASSLRALGKEVTVLNEDGCPSTLAFLPESETVGQPGTEPVSAELCVALDTANRARLGENCLAATAHIPRLLNIDHHVSNEGYGDIVHVDDGSPATGQIIYELIASQDFPLTEAARDALFVAISTDTGGFRYPATTAKTYEIGAALMRAGADCGRLSSLTYERYPFSRIELLRELLGVLKLNSDRRVASWALDLKTKEALSLRPEDGEGIIDVIRAIDTVVVAVFFEELRNGTVRISMRSKDREVADVCKVCQAFGGGGHPLASGARVEGDLDDVVGRVLDHIEKVIN